MSKKSGKKRNQVDPILQMAKRNRDESLARMLAEKNDKTIQKNRHDHEQAARRELDAELETQRLFNHMKRRDF